MSRWPKYDAFLSHILLLIIVVYVILVYFQLPFYTNLMFLLPMVLVYSLLIDGVKIAIESISVMMRKPTNVPYSPIGNSQLTVIIACHNGENKVGATVLSVRNALPGAHIVVVDDASNDDTSNEALLGGAKVLKLGVNKGKVVAIHKVLEFVKTDFVLIMDDDMTINKLVMPYYLLNKFDAIAFNVVPKGDSFWVKLQKFEYIKSMEIGKRYYAPYGSVLCVSGAIGLFRTAKLQEQIGLHSGEFSGEDLERTLLVHSTLTDSESKGVTYTNQYVYTDVPISISELFRQRCLGWNPGFIANLALLTKILMNNKTSWRLKIESFYNLSNVFLDTLRIASLPLLFRYPYIFFAMYLIYLLLDSIAWFATDQIYSFWVIFLMPFYGIFCLITRFIGLFIWVYRELVELFFLKMRHHPDSYKLAPHPYHLVSLFLVINIVCIGFYYINAILF